MELLHQAEATASIASSVVQGVVLVAIWVPAIVGNVLTCIVVHRSRRLQSTTNCFVVSLAVADLVLVVLAMPFVFGQAVSRRWVFAPFMCRFVRFVQFLVPGAVSFVFVATCVDRFYAVLRPLSRVAVTRVRAGRLVVGAWLAAAALASPAFGVFRAAEKTGSSGGGGDGTLFCAMYAAENNGSPSSPGAIAYVAVVTVMAFVLPAIACSVLYGRISRFIWTVGFGGRPFQRTTNPVPRAKVKMVKMLIVLNATSVALMAPFFVVQLVRCCCVRSADDNDGESLYLAIVWTYFSSAALKPILYVCLNSNFRRGCKEVICMSAMRCYRSHAYTITTTSTLAKKNHVGVVGGGGMVGAEPGASGGSGRGSEARWTSVSAPESKY